MMCQVAIPTVPTVQYLQLKQQAEKPKWFLKSYGFHIHYVCFVQEIHSASSENLNTDIHSGIRTK